MSVRELVVLGTASQAPTRERNHNGYLLRWDSHGILFDPGEGTQRQMLAAGVAAHDINRICVSHFHGDHSLGLPGVIQRMNLDRVRHPVTAHYPASGAEFFDRLRHSTAFYETVELVERPAAGEHTRLLDGPDFELTARRLSHPVEAYGYRLVEPDGTRMLPEALAARGIKGPAVGRLRREGTATAADGSTVGLAEVSEIRRGGSFAFVMDTRMCEAVEQLAEGADLLVIESTFLERDAAHAESFGHLTAGQAARAATAAGVRTLVLTHFSQRYRDAAEFGDEARAFFDGEIVVAEDLMRIPVPRNPRKTPGGDVAPGGYHAE